MLVTKSDTAHWALAVPMAVWAGWGVGKGLAKGGRAPTIRKKYKILDKIDAIKTSVFVCVCLQPVMHCRCSP